MRLSTLNFDLSNRLINAADLENANNLYEKVFWHSYGTLEETIRKELESENVLSCLARREIPSLGEIGNLSESFDEKYFGLEDEGKYDVSRSFFKKARLTAALALSCKANSRLEYAEAAYEALMATDDPNSEVNTILKRLSVDILQT